MPNLHELENAMPVAPLKIIALPSAEKMGRRINDYMVEFRKSIHNDKVKNDPAFHGYIESNYLVDVDVPRFGSGEAKAQISETIRGKDLFILTDVCNHSITYNMNGYTNHMSPDDHYQDLKRVIAACNGKARRINVIMPFLYEGRQHRRSGRESLDCAYALEELRDMGIDNFITFDAHDPRVQNSTPLNGFDNFTTPYQFIKSLLNSEDDMIVDKDHLLVANFVVEQGIQIVKNACPVDGSTKREYARQLMEQINRETPGAKDRMMHAIVNGRFSDWPG